MFRWLTYYVYVYRFVIKLRAIGFFMCLPIRGVDSYSLRLDACQLSPAAGEMIAVSEIFVLCPALLQHQSMGSILY